MSVFVNLKTKVRVTVTRNRAEYYYYYLLLYTSYSFYPRVNNVNKWMNEPGWLFSTYPLSSASTLSALDSLFGRTAVVSGCHGACAYARAPQLFDGLALQPAWARTVNALSSTCFFKAAGRGAGVIIWQRASDKKAFPRSSCLRSGGVVSFRLYCWTLLGPCVSEELLNLWNHLGLLLKGLRFLRNNGTRISNGRTRFLE